MQLQDASGLPLAGKTVTVGTSSSTVQFTSSTAVTDTQGIATFTATDTAAESVPVDASDTTDGVTLTSHPMLTFITPLATGAQITASQATVPDDGSSSSTVMVYLENGLGHPAAGKTVMLSQTGSATITPVGSATPGDTAVTGADGYADFTVTDTTAESVQFTAVDSTDGDLPVPGSASVTYFSGSPATCPMGSVPASGYGLETFASPFPFDPYAQTLPGNFTLGACDGIAAPAFDSSGNALVTDDYSGTITELPPRGGTPGTDNQLPDANFGRDDLHGLAFGKDGELYAQPRPSASRRRQQQSGSGDRSA